MRDDKKVKVEALLSRIWLEKEMRNDQRQLTLFNSVSLGSRIAALSDLALPANANGQKG